MPRKSTEQIPAATRYLGTPDLKVRYAGKTRRTLKRWEDEKILPPPDLVVHGKKFWRETTLDEADRRNTIAAGANGSATEFARRRKAIAAE
jgi:hypothetical protein